MFNFFRGKPDKTNNVPAPSERVYQKGEQLSAEEKKDLRAQAMANAKMARDAIGEETLQKIVAAMQLKEQQDRDNSPMMQAKKILLQLDKNLVSDGLRAMIREQEKPH